MNSTTVNPSEFNMIGFTVNLNVYIESFWKIEYHVEQFWQLAGNYKCRNKRQVMLQAWIEMTNVFMYDIIQTKNKQIKGFL